MDDVGVDVCLLFGLRLLFSRVEINLACELANYDGIERKGKATVESHIS